MDFKVIPRKIPGKPEEPQKYYASIVRPKKIELKRLAKRIAEVSPVNELDTETVLTALTRIMPEYLVYGATVELGELGRLQVNISSVGADSEEDFSKDMIKSNKISFQPGMQVKEAMKLVTYDKVKD
jgi:predicted histone-like DNA-binding protein